MMTSYRRNRIAGGTYFFTVNPAGRSESWLIDHIDMLGEAFRYTHERHPFATEALVVLPNHLHALWTPPPGDVNYSLRWRLVKTVFSRSLPRKEYISESRHGKSERGIWQRRYWEHTIRDDIDYARHVEYIHINPVKHGYVTRAADWPHSSIHRYIKAGLVAHDWAAIPNETADLGEMK